MRQPHCPASHDLRQQHARKGTLAPCASCYPASGKVHDAATATVGDVMPDEGWLYVGCQGLSQNQQEEAREPGKGRGRRLVKHISLEEHQHQQHQHQQEPPAASVHDADWPALTLQVQKLQVTTHRQTLKLQLYPYVPGLHDSHNSKLCVSDCLLTLPVGSKHRTLCSLCVASLRSECTWCHHAPECNTSCLLPPAHCAHAHTGSVSTRWVSLAHGNVTVLWAAWYITRLLVKLTPKGVVFSFLFNVTVHVACVGCRSSRGGCWA